MQAKFRTPLIAGLVLMAVLPLAAAESPLPDPVAPAVIGRPLDQIRPARVVRQKPKAVRVQAAKPPAQAQPVAQAPHGPKQALDDRADPRALLPDNVGKGQQLGRKPLAPGAYLNSKAQDVVRRYYEANPQSAKASKWNIGQPVAPDAKLQGVPDAVRAALPRVPPGHQYVQLDGEVLLVAVPSRMVVDGVSRAVR